jgi:NhaP-type Na+/H+ or K+/H+ antiporter
MDLLNHTLALVGVVIIVAALLSGMIDRTGLPQVLLFLLLGVALGPSGLNLVNFTLESNALRVVAILGLVLVLFSDAVGIDIGGMRGHVRLLARVLGPGTVVSAALIALAARVLLHVSVPAAAILGAALASTDPVLMRSLLRREEVPSAAREALRFESGVNDVVLLPIVLIAMMFLRRDADLSGSEWSRLGLDLFLLGPGAGVGTGLIGIALLDFIRKRFGVRRDYESLYALGVAFTAYAAAEAVHGSGFLAAFAAGITIATLDVELCDCFLDYGQATAEMFLLFTFVAFGSGLIWEGLGVISGPSLLFAAVALFIRSPVMWLSLLGMKLDAPSRPLIVWFGPRGLSSLLLILLPVFAGLAGTEALFPICALVVLLSVVIHGAMLPVLMRRLSPTMPASSRTTPAVPSPPADKLDGPQPTPGGGGRTLPVFEGPAGSERITLGELQRLWDRGEPVTLLDVRKDRTYRDDDLQARGAIRLHPDRARITAAELALPREDWLVAYCT